MGFVVSTTSGRLSYLIQRQTLGRQFQFESKEIGWFTVKEIDAVSINKVARLWFDNLGNCSVFRMVIAGADDFDLISRFEPLSGGGRAIPVRQHQGAPFKLPCEDFDDAPAFGALSQMSLFRNF